MRQNFIVYIPNKFNWITGCFSLTHYKLYSCKPKMCTLCFTSLYASCRPLGFWSFDTKKFTHMSQIDSVNKKSCTLIPKSFHSSICAVFILKWGPHVICKMFQQLGCPHQVIWELSLWAGCRLLLLGGYSAESKVVYHLPKFSGKSSWKVNGTQLFGSFHREISWSNGTSGRVVLFFRTVYSQQKSMFRLLEAIFDTGFRSFRLFFDKWNWFVPMVNAILGWNLPVLNCAFHLSRPWTDWFAHANNKQPKFPAVTHANKVISKSKNDWTCEALR